MCASRALCRRLVGSYAEPSLLAELPRCRLVEADGELLGCVGLPRAGRPGGEVVLVGVELVLHLARRVVEQLDRVRREAAERLEEQRVDDVLLSLREVVVAPLRLEAAVAGLRVVLVVRRVASLFTG